MNENILVVHALWHGLAPCGFSRDLPRDWPANHRWTWRQDSENITCEDCRRWALKSLAQGGRLADAAGKTKESAD